MSIIQVNTIRSKSGSSAPTCDQGLVVTGIATLGSVKVQSGFITATTGIVTYYGDGQYLSNAGIAVTYIPNNLSILGVTTITPRLDVGTGVTINEQGINAVGIITAGSYQGNGSTLVGLVTTIVAGTNITIVSSGSTTGTGIVTISAFDDKGFFVNSASGIHTTSNVGIGTTNATSKLTVSGDAIFTGVVTATTFVGNLTGTATTSTTVDLVSSGSTTTTQYVTFVESSSGGEEVRIDTSLTYTPSSDLLRVGNITATGIVTSAGLRVGTGGTALSVTSSTSNVGIGTTNANYVLEVGPVGKIGITEYVNGDLQTSQHLFIGGGANITGVTTALRYVGNGDGLVGVASTVQVKFVSFDANLNVAVSGTFTKANYGPINWVFVQVVGGGGGGASASSAGGGGSGSVNQRLFRAQDLPDLCALVAGAGGNRGSNGAGGNGGESYFEVAADNYLRADGGRGGSGATGGAGGDNVLISVVAASAGAGGYFSAAGGSGGANNGGNSIFGPSAGGGGGSSSSGAGGVTRSLGSLNLAAGIGVTSLYGGMGKGGNGRSGSTPGSNGGFPGGGGGGSNSTQVAGYGGGGCVRIWMW